MSAAQTAERLHPAAARRMARKVPPRPHHDVTLRALGRSSDSAGRIAVFSEPDFLGALWADLRSEDWLDLLDAREPDASDRTRLPLPMHRQTVLVLFEASCAVPGRPRLAREKIESMGLVIRREGSSDSAPLAWMKAHGKPLGWNGMGGIETLDPDPTQRSSLFQSSNHPLLERVVDARNANALPSEDVVALQAVPGDIRADLGRTILFAVLPLSSSESSPAAQDAYDYNALDPINAGRLDALYDWPWQAGGLVPLDKSGQVIDPAWTSAGVPRDPTLTDLITLTRQAVVECGMGDNNAAAVALRQAFAAISLPLSKDSDGQVLHAMPADEWLLSVAPILLGSETNTAGIAMPVEWPRRHTAQSNALMSAMRSCLTQQAARFQPDTPKFDDPDTRYRGRPFLRVRHAPDCPIRLIWGEPGRQFGIRPWWDSDAPPHKISLPDLDNVKDLKPNIAFDLPPQLAAMVAKDPEDLMEGKGARPAKTGIGWLCSFSLPVITICAFIALNIFLKLFNFFFRWMLWIKICIPIPKKEG